MDSAERTDDDLMHTKHPLPTPAPLNQRNAGAPKSMSAADRQFIIDTLRQLEGLKRKLKELLDK